MFTGEPDAFFHHRNIEIGRAPRDVLVRARRVVEKLESGQPYWNLGGKRLTDNRARISIPLGRRWRLLADDVDGRIRARAVLSHETYNKTI